MTMDARDDEAAWGRAAVLAGFLTAGPDPRPAAYATTVCLAWGPDRLYAFFSCENDAIRSSDGRRDDDIWKSEAVEMFLCPAGPDAPYYEIDVNPQNVLYDSRVYDWRYKVQVEKYKEWAKAYNPDVESATRVHRNDKGEVVRWTAEMAVPFEDLNHTGHAPPASGDIWHFNVFRVAHGEDGRIEFSAWAPTYGGFHLPHQFPELIFME